MTAGETWVDVCVVGAGPAGAAAAGSAVASGASVIVVDLPSRASRGMELLSGRAAPSLQALGVLAEVSAAAIPCAGSVSRWATADFVARPALLDPWGGGWIIDRARLDSLLTAAATARGVRTVAGRVVAVEPHPGGGRDVRLADGRRVRAGAVVVAAGRPGVLLRGAVSPVVDHRLVVLTADLPAGAVPDLGHQLLVDRAAEGWWYALASPASTTIAFCTDGDLVGRGQAGVVSTWRRACATADWIPGTARSAPDRLRSRIVGAVTRPCVNEARLVGDAALAVDPLSGHGVTLALEGGRRWADPQYTQWFAVMSADHRAQQGAVFAAASGPVDGVFWHRRRPRATPGVGR